MCISETMSQPHFRKYTATLWGKGEAIRGRFRGRDRIWMRLCLHDERCILHTTLEAREFMYGDRVNAKENAECITLVRWLLSVIVLVCQGRAEVLVEHREVFPAPSGGKARRRRGDLSASGRVGKLLPQGAQAECRLAASFGSLVSPSGEGRRDLRPICMLAALIPLACARVHHLQRRADVDEGGNFQPLDADDGCNLETEGRKRAAAPRGWPRRASSIPLGPDLSPVA